jgi:hypothetical protein
MIAAPVQCDVDGVPKGSHFAKLPPMGVNGRALRSSARPYLRKRRRGQRSDRLNAGPLADGVDRRCVAWIVVRVGWWLRLGLWR